MLKVVFCSCFFVLNMTLINFIHVNINSPGSFIPHSIFKFFILRIMFWDVFCFYETDDMTNSNTFPNNLPRIQLKGKMCLFVYNQARQL